MRADQFRKISDEQKVSMGEVWFDLIEKDHFWMEWRLRSVLRFFKEHRLDVNKKIKCLDVGAGPGIFSKQIENNSAWIVDGADLNSEALKMSPDLRGHTLLYDITEENAEFVNQYDIVFLCDVIEHIKEPAGFLESVLKHVRSGGLIFINVPAYESLFSKYDEAVGHYRRYNKHSLKLELADQEVEIVGQRYWGGMLFLLLLVRTAIMNLFMKNKGTDEIIKQGMHPPSKLFNSMMKIVMKIELFFYRRSMFGSSLMLLARKK